MPRDRACKPKPRPNLERFQALQEALQALQEQINRSVSELLGRPVRVEGLLPRR